MAFIGAQVLEAGKLDLSKSRIQSPDRETSRQHQGGYEIRAYSNGYHKSSHN